MYSELSIREPYRLFFPLGVVNLLWGALLWIPLIWDSSNYPVMAHRYLMLNGFAASFIGGFLMTAVPKFSKTNEANRLEVFSYFLLTILGIRFSYMESENIVLLISAFQPIFLLFFLFKRISKRKENPPFSFVFIFVGLFLWVLSALAGIFLDSEAFKELHYEGAIAAIILGVGSRLIPGILGHVDIVGAQRVYYEKPISIFSTIPKSFLFLIVTFVVSYFLPERLGSFIRFIDVAFVAVNYWRLYQFPKERTSLTWSIWMASWFIVLSFLLRFGWNEGMIHGSHAFFITGIVLLSLMIATRVLQSHGPKDKSLENHKVLYLVTFLLFVAAMTRVSAYIMPESYFSHLAYSALLLTTAVVAWSYQYLRYITAA